MCTRGGVKKGGGLSTNSFFFLDFNFNFQTGMKTSRKKKGRNEKFREIFLETFSYAYSGLEIEHYHYNTEISTDAKLRIIFISTSRPSLTWRGGVPGESVVEGFVENLSDVESRRTNMPTAYTTGRAWQRLAVSRGVGEAWTVGPATDNIFTNFSHHQSGLRWHPFNVAVKAA